MEDKVLLLKIELKESGDDFIADVEIGCGEAYTEDQLSKLERTVKHLSEYMVKTLKENI